MGLAHRHWLLAFQPARSADGTVGERDFLRLTDQLAAEAQPPRPLSPQEHTLRRALMRRVFHLADRGACGRADASDLCSALAMLCGLGEAQHHAEALFEAIDGDGDGAVSQAELRRHLEHVFHMIWLLHRHGSHRHL